MIPLVLYVFPVNAPEDDPVRAATSFGEVRYQVIEDRRIDLIEDHGEPWYGYVFANEIVDADVRRVLPVWLEQPFDVIVMMKKELVGDPPEPRAWQAPRLFRSHVKLQEGLLIPEENSELSVERMLDGWVLNGGL